MKKTACFLLILFVFLSIAWPVWGQVSVSLTLDRREATLTDAIRLEVSVSGTRRSDAPPVIAGLDPFHVTGGGSASRVEIINGRYNSSVDYTYYLQPKKEGVFSVGPARVKVDGKTVQSNLATLKVVRGGDVSGDDRGPVFLTAALSAQKVYVEEQAPYTLKLYLRANVSDISLDLPETDDLTFRQLEKPKEYQSVYHGVSYRILEVRYAVMPLKTGLFHVPPARMGLTVYSAQQKSPRSLFDDPFFGGALRTGRPMSVSSESLALEVLPFPEKGKPIDFSGLVGVFAIRADLSAFKIGVGESATLTVRLSGKGNVNRLPDIKMPSLEHLKVYADEPVFETTAGADGLTGSKTMKWALVPGKAGMYRIPAFTVSYFDPKARVYLTEKTQPLVLEVLQGEAKTGEGNPQREKPKEPVHPSKQTVKEIGHDILPIYTAVSSIKGGSWLKTDEIGLGNLFVWIILLGPFLVYISVLMVLRAQKKSDTAIGAQRARKAAGVFLKACRHEEKDANGMMTAIRDYINDRFQLSLGSVTPADVPGLLTAKGVREHTALRLQEVLAQLEGRIYTGRESECGPVHQDILEIIKQIEKEI